MAMAGFGITIPIMPFMARDLGASPIEVSLLVSLFGLAQFLSGPIWGGLSDRYGRRPILLVSVFGTLLGFLLLGFAAPIGEMLARWLAPSATKTFVLGVLELTFVAQGINNRLMIHPMEIYGTVAFFYFICCYSMSVFAARLERRLSPEKVSLRM